MKNGKKSITVLQGKEYQRMTLKIRGIKHKFHKFFGYPEDKWARGGVSMGMVVVMVGTDSLLITMI